MSAQDAAEGAHPSRQRTLAAALIALVWAVVLVFVVGPLIAIPFMVANLTLIASGLAVGLLLIVMIEWTGIRRWRDGAPLDGGDFAPGSPGAIDRRVLSNTCEQALVAALVWPAVSVSLGPGMVAALAANFVLARVLYWIGYHRAAELRVLGFGATFYPTVLAAIWSLWRWVS